MGLEYLGPDGQLAAWETRATDPRKRVRTGLDPLDALLHRGGFAPSELVILAGRTRTRKTTVALNLIAAMLGADLHVGFAGLEESVANYTAKLASIFFNVMPDELEEDWGTERGYHRAQEFKERASKLSLTRGYRPTADDLSLWKEQAEDSVQQEMQVVFIDYSSLLNRNQFDGAEVQRIARLIEEVQVWTKDEDVVTIMLHQVGRQDEGGGGRYHGDTPLFLESLKYGGEEMADVVLGVYRPELNPIAAMDWETALDFLPDHWKEETANKVWHRARERAVKYAGITFLQLLKNRPGTATLESGFQLESSEHSLRMWPAKHSIGEDMKLIRGVPAQEEEHEGTTSSA